MRASGALVAFTVTLVLHSTPGPVSGQAGEPEAPPFVPTPDAVVDLMLDMAEVRPGDIVYDLGSGDGRLVIGAALRDARAIGIEYDAPLVALSRELAARAGVTDRASFVHGDIFETDFSDADVVMLYLSPEFNLRLRSSLLRSLAPGARVVSHAFHMGDWEEDETRTVGDGAGRATIYLWIVPARADGFWILDPGDDRPAVTIELMQTFQRLRGEARISGRQVPIVGVVRGDRVSFSTERAGSGQELAFEGALIDGRLVGVLSGTPASERVPAVIVRPDDPSRAPL